MTVSYKTHIFTVDTSGTFDPAYAPTNAVVANDGFGAGSLSTFSALLATANQLSGYDLFG
jgi:hypothetical protein